MKNMVRVAVIGSMILCCQLCYATDQVNDEPVRTLMEKSGMDKQINEIPKLLQAELDRQQQDTQGLSQEEFNRLSLLTKSAFEAKAIRSAVQTYIKSNLPELDVRAVLGWLESPLGKKITRLEENASTANAYAEMQAMGPKLLDDNKDSARMVKMKRLDDAIGATESSVNTVLNIQVALITAMTATMDADRRPSYEDVQGLANKSKLQIQSAVKRMIQIQFLYTYRDLTDLEIDRYNEFAESASGQRYHQVTIRAINDALVRAARQIGSQIGIRMNAL